MRSIFETFFKRGFSIIGIALLAALVVVGGTYLRTPQYQSEARIVIPFGREITAPVTGPSAQNAMQAMMVFVNRSEQVQTQMEVLLNRQLIENVVAKIPEDSFVEQPPTSFVKQLYWKFQKEVLRPALALLENYGLLPKMTDRERLVVDFSRRLSVQRQNESEILVIAFRHSSTEFAQAFLQEFIMAYEEMRASGGIGESSVPFFANQEEKLRAELQNATAALSKFREEWGLLDVTVQRDQFIHEFIRLEGQINQTKSDLVQAEASLKTLQENTTHDVTENILPRSMREDQAFMENLRSLANLQARESRLRAEVGAEHPERHLISGELDALRSTIFNSAVTNLQTQVANSRVMLQELERQRQDNMERMKLLDAKALEMMTLQADVDLANEALLEYGRNREKSRVMAAMDIQQVNAIQIIEAPNKPYQPVSPRPLRDILLGSIFGLLLGFCYAFLREHVSGTINSVEYMGEEFPSDMIVDVPDLRMRGGQLRVPELAMSMMIRKFFYKGKHLHLPKTFLLVGSNHEVGTTSMADALASHLAENMDLRVLRVTTDISGKARSKVGGGSASLSAWLDNRGMPPICEPGAVHALPAGSGEPKARTTLLRLTAGDLAELGDYYDMIIFDAPPTTSDSISFHLSSLAEACVVVVRMEMTRKAVLARTKADLALSGANVLGVICNRRHFYIPRWIYRRLK